MAAFSTPSSITLFEVSMPQHHWGRDLDEEDKAREIVDKYLYGDFEIVAAEFDTDERWHVLVRYTDFGGTLLEYQTDRLASGGFRTEILANYVKEA